MDINLEKNVSKPFATVSICTDRLEMASKSRINNKEKIAELFVFNHHYNYVIFLVQLNIERKNQRRVN